MFRLAIPLAFFLSVSGCSCIVNFDPEGQPCDSAGQCLPDYTCGGDKLCHKGTTVVPAPDGGTVITPDGGSTCAKTTETACTDGLDDDCDGKIDCRDDDCLGKACDDGDACTVNESCGNSGTCAGGSPKTCNTPPACQGPTGTCQAGTGMCVYPMLAEGASCGSAAGLRCCGGACINITANTSNCGGCGLVCGSAQLCQSLNQSSCGIEPSDTSGRCTCSATAPCPKGQTCAASGFCIPVSAAQCAANQTVTTIATCQAYCAY